MEQIEIRFVLPINERVALTHSVHVLLRHRLLLHPRRSHGLVTIEIRTHPRDLAATKVEEYGERVA